MMRMLSITACLLSLMVSVASAFVTPQYSSKRFMGVKKNKVGVVQKQPMHMVTDPSQFVVPDFLLSRFYLDISQISDDPYLPIFAGGMGIVILSVGAIFAVGGLLKNFRSSAYVVYDQYRDLLKNPDLIEDLPPEWEAFLKDYNFWKEMDKIMKENPDMTGGDLVNMVEPYRVEVFLKVRREQAEIRRKKEEADELVAQEKARKKRELRLRAEKEEELTLNLDTPTTAAPPTPELVPSAESSKDLDIFSDYEVA